MEHTQISLEEVVRLSKKLFHDYYSGDNKKWFSLLCSESIYLGTAEPMLFGEDAIKNYFNKKTPNNGTSVKIIQEEYFPLSLSADAAQICGQIIVQNSHTHRKAITHFSICYKIISGEIKIIHQHNSYQFLQHDNKNKNNSFNIDIATTRFVRDLLLDKSSYKRISLRCGSDTVFVNPNTILYFQSQRKQTEAVCLDRVIACKIPIGELSKTLPPEFISVHRSYIVNTRYVSTIRRFELELVSGICIPIPAASYMALKEKIQKML